MGRKAAWVWAAAWLAAAPLGAMELDGTGTLGSADWMGALTRAYAPLAVQAPLHYDAQESRHGIARWLDKGADFLVVTQPLSPADDKRAGTGVMRLPVGLTAVVITYNLPGVPSGLRLTPRALAQIFSGEITRWDNSNLRVMNPGLTLPDLPIRVLHRDDENSLFDLFPAWLKDQDGSWPLADAGPDQRLKWPLGRGVRGDEGLLRALRETAGSIGAADYVFAAQRGLPAACLENDLGAYVAPTPESLTAAVGDFAQLPADFMVSVSRPRDAGAYPLTSFEWVLARS
ncbi:MAG TPA: substrate-binding domain-containing protein, partial [bacterium]|nr:substrate-binding domain-containing protein [bacterium]